MAYFREPKITNAEQVYNITEKSKMKMNPHWDGTTNHSHANVLRKDQTQGMLILIINPFRGNNL